TEVLGAPPDEVVLAPARAVLKTSSGKLRRSDTRARYLAGRLDEGSRSTERQLWHLLLAGVRERLRRWPTALYVAYARTLFGLLAAPLWMALMLMPSVRWRWALARGGVRLLRWLTGVRLAVEGRERLPAPGTPCILVANHASYLDALVLAEAMGRPLAFVAKRELGRRRWMRRALERLGTRFVERFDVRQGGADLDRLDAALAQGETLVFFPEGTFREQPGLLPFRMGAFALAARTAAPLVPVTLIGTRERMAGDGFRPSPGPVRVVIEAPLVPAGRAWEAGAALRDAARAAIAGRLGEAP
ncbi:MAG: 1-acyl-sn-glycerol-3-phosphate acyltransferase, partial [Chromatiaceae bacterium]|nr:1-acyl-sn-glycerol-3-phosphate acyltransferase [Chromatiaceae bacterium]